MAAVLIVGGVGSAAVAAAAPAQAASPGQAVDLGDLQASSMVQTHGKLFIGAGNEVLVRGLHGENLGSITHEFGVADLLLSPDGNTVYAADFAGSAISVIDPVSATETAHWPLGTCPSHLALLGGRLFVSYGCTLDAQLNSIGSVDAGTGGPLVDSGAGHDFYNPPFLANANGNLLARYSGLSSMTTYRYAASGAGLTLLNSMDVGGARIVLSPDGTRMAIPTNSNGIIEYDSSTFAELGRYANGNPGPWFTALKYSPTTGRLAGAEFDAGQINVYDTTSRAQLVASRPAPAGNTYAPSVLDATLTFRPGRPGQSRRHGVRARQLPRLAHLPAERVRDRPDAAAPDPDGDLAEGLRPAGDDLGELPGSPEHPGDVEDAAELRLADLCSGANQPVGRDHRRDQGQLLRTGLRLLRR
ncbi:MAG TPA: hypothetical protein VFD94_09915 [Jatrophihabitans sp.]|nr:hypothetical protein [Jatrophihabitans sp.]